MPLNPDAVNDPPGPPSERSWNSKDALLYAVGVGAGSVDPNGFELEFTTENSKDVAAAGAADVRRDHRHRGR